MLLLNNSQISLTNQNNIIIENNIVPFVKYNNPLMTIKKKYVLDMNYIDNPLLQRSRMINYYGKIKDNEINMITFNDFKDKLDMKYLKYYFPTHYINNLNEIENLNYLNKSFLIREKYNINYNLSSFDNNKKNKSINNKLLKYMSINECGIKKLDFHLNSELFLNYLDDKEMLFCFNKFKTFYDLPIIHISYNNRTEKKYKVNKPFLNYAITSLTYVREVFY